MDPTAARDFLVKMDWRVAHLILRPFLDAYAVVANQLLDADAVDEEKFIARCLVVGHQWALQRIIASEESVSGEMFRTAMRLARHRGLLETENQDVVERRRHFAAEVDEFRARIGRAAMWRDESPIHPTPRRPPVGTDG
jgi:glycerol-3-phosphate O-acyltransferase